MTDIAADEACLTLTRETLSCDSYKLAWFCTGWIIVTAKSLASTDADFRKAQSICLATLLSTWRRSSGVIYSFYKRGLNYVVILTSVIWTRPISLGGILSVQVLQRFSATFESPPSLNIVWERSIPCYGYSYAGCLSAYMIQYIEKNIFLLSFAKNFLSWIFSSESSPVGKNWNNIIFDINIYFSICDIIFWCDVSVSNIA